MVALNLPAVTVGIPFFNAETTLLDAVRSVFAQSHSNWELILMDDGSSDGSLDLARSIRDPRVRVYSDGRNRRLAARLNEITSLAKYDFIARMDADDLMSPVRLERQLELLSSRPDIDIVSTGLCSLRDDYSPDSIRGVPSTHQITARRLLAGNVGIVHASIVGRRAWFERNSYDESLFRGEDANLWVRSFAKKDLNVAFLEDILYYYREDANISRERLLLAYRDSRYTLINHAKEGFNGWDKITEFSRNLLKSLAVFLFAELGVLKLLRQRRNKSELDEATKSDLIKIINKIKAEKLPLIEKGVAQTYE
ncbi:glycosyltransferase family 2 protein [Sphingomonas sp. C8-2]|jgi:glycosyltransferase involved in cell wall biosynthesis|nr:glycosyltransferase family 2 protein [Sphingomonas sp. C8-2]